MFLPSENYPHALFPCHFLYHQIRAVSDLCPPGTGGTASVAVRAGDQQSPVGSPWARLCCGCFAAEA